MVHDVKVIEHWLASVIIEKKSPSAPLIIHQVKSNELWLMSISEFMTKAVVAHVTLHDEKIIQLCPKRVKDDAR